MIRTEPLSLGRLTEGMVPVNATTTASPSLLAPVEVPGGRTISTWSWLIGGQHFVSTFEYGPTPDETARRSDAALAELFRYVSRTMAYTRKRSETDMRGWLRELGYSDEETVHARSL